MYLIKVMERFRSQEACIQHLEQVRWGKGYPHLTADLVVKHT